MALEYISDNFDVRVGKPIDGRLFVGDGLGYAGQPMDFLSKEAIPDQYRFEGMIVSEFLLGEVKTYILIGGLSNIHYKGVKACNLTQAPPNSVSNPVVGEIFIGSDNGTIWVKEYDGTVSYALVIDDLEPLENRATNLENRATNLETYNDESEIRKIFTETNPDEVGTPSSGETYVGTWGNKLWSKNYLGVVNYGEADYIFRGYAGLTDAEPVELTNGNWVRASATGTMTNFDGLTVVTGNRIEYCLETDSWGVYDDSWAGALVLSASLDGNTKKIINLEAGNATGEVSTYELTEAQNIQLLISQNTDWINKGFAKVGDATPTATLNHAYTVTGIAPSATGTVFGVTVDNASILVGNGTHFIKHSISSKLSYKINQSHEFMHALVDVDDTLLFGVKYDGSVYIPKGIPKESSALFSDLYSKINLIDGAIKKESLTENYVEVTLDSEDKILAYRTSDGLKTEEKLRLGTQALATVEGQIIDDLDSKGFFTVEENVSNHLSDSVLLSNTNVTYPHNAFPGGCAGVKEGVVHAIYRKATYHGSPTGKTVYKYSLDYGETWSAEIDFLNFGADSEGWTMDFDNARMLKLDNDKILVVGTSMRRKHGFPAEKYLLYVTMFSEDATGALDLTNFSLKYYYYNTSTETLHQVTSSPAKNPVGDSLVFGLGILLHNSTVYITGYSSLRAIIIKSDNCNSSSWSYDPSTHISTETWEKVNHVRGDSDVTQKYNENTIIFLEDIMYMIIRYSNSEDLYGHHNSVLYSSLDSGVTLTKLELANTWWEGMSTLQMTDDLFVMAGRTGSVVGYNGFNIFDGFFKSIFKSGISFFDNLTFPTTGDTGYCQLFEGSGFVYFIFYAAINESDSTIANVYIKKIRKSVLSHDRYFFTNYFNEFQIDKN